MNEIRQTLRIHKGKEGTLETLAAMRDLIVDSKLNNPAIRDKASEIVKPCAGHDFKHECEFLFNFCRDAIRYERDPRGVELLQTAARTLETRYGDCDDKTTLFCSLCESIGHKTRLVAVGFDDSPMFQHVFAQVMVNEDWVTADATPENKFFGWTPDGVTKRMVLAV